MQLILISIRDGDEGSYRPTTPRPDTAQTMIMVKYPGWSVIHR